MLIINLYSLNLILKKNKYLFFNKKNNFLGIIFLILIINIIVYCGFFIVKWMNNTSYLKLFKLDITGYLNYTTNSDIYKIIHSIGIKSTFISKNINIIRKNIEKLPLIKYVSIRKKWPNKLLINIVEYIPIARWNNKYVLDANGTLIKLPNNYTINSNMISLFGPKNSEKTVLKVYYSINNIIRLGYLNLKLVSMSSRQSWQIVINNNIRINLGRHNIINRLKLFIEIYPRLLKNNAKINYVDLRYNSGLAVSWLPNINISNKTNQN